MHAKALEQDKFSTQAMMIVKSDTGSRRCSRNAGMSMSLCSGDELAGTTGLSDALLGNLGEFLSSDEAWDLWELSLSKDLEVALIATTES